MQSEQWREFFMICHQSLGEGSSHAKESHSWCSWTTFERLQRDAGYWTSGLPNAGHITDIGINDGGVWGQPFLYRDLAHIVVPAQFYWESIESGSFTNGTRTQDIVALAASLRTAGIPHRATSLILELKFY